MKKSVKYNLPNAQGKVIDAVVELVESWLHIYVWGSLVQSSGNSLIVLHLIYIYIYIYIYIRILAEIPRDRNRDSDTCET
jgi:hypothetical protein